MSAMLERVRKAATKVHPNVEVIVTGGDIIEIALPEDCGLVWLASEGTLLVADADRFGSMSAALRETLADIKWGVRPA